MHQPWETSLRMEKMPGVLLYRQVASSVIERVGKGLLVPGARLPGTRALARTLGVHRNTVKAAYDELQAAGWVRITPSRGTFIATELPADPGRVLGMASGEARRKAARAAFEWIGPVQMEGSLAELPYRQTLVCSEGVPDLQLSPMAEMARELRHVLKPQKAWSTNDVRGHAGLRALVAERLRHTRAIPALPEEILLTGGQRMSLYLTARAMLREGATVAVEQPGNKAAWEVFAQCGLRVTCIPVDKEGICVEQLAARPGVDAVYVTPLHQYPTTVRMSAARRERLLEWGRDTGALLIEDDGDSEFEFDGVPALPLASMDPDVAVVHMGPVTRIFAPAVEAGFMRSSRGAIARLCRVRAVMGRSSERLQEAALFELAVDGVLRRHLRRARQIYRERRDHLVLRLNAEFGCRLKVAIPSGGLALWAHGSEEIDTQKWAETARRLGVRFAPASEYMVGDSPWGGIRLGFAALTREELATVAATLRRALPTDIAPSAGEFSPETITKFSQLRRCIA